MAVTSSERVPGEGSEPPAGTLLIDCDVHEGFSSVEQLMPYLDPHSQRLTKRIGGNNIANPNGFPYVIPIETRNGARGDWEDLDALVVPAASVEVMQEQLFAREGVTHAILNGFSYFSARAASYEFATALTRAYNDWQIHDWLDKDPRVFGSVHVVTNDPQAAAREIDRAGAHPQMVQVFLPLVTDRQYGDPMYRPIFEAAARNQLAIGFHHGAHTDTLVGWPRYYIEWHMVAAPHSAQFQLISLICNGVLDQLPDLKVAFMETGVAWVPWFLWRMDQQYRELRNEIPWVKRLPSETIKDSVRVSTQPLGDITSQQFTQLVEMSESERIFTFASDYPHYDADSVDVVLGRAVPEALRNRVRSTNALEIYPRLASSLT
jgi:predicted TIM-barrel fold metal-dependent hydrolase